MPNNRNIKKKVREAYARAAEQSSCCCDTEDTTTVGTANPESITKKIGYSAADIGAVPDGATSSFGCGNPTAIATIQKGETILDLGSGLGFDCFIAARKVGKKGKIIGVDMTPEMIDKARENADKGDFGNVEFRLGEIENLPAADRSVDAVISNCVINLSVDKRRVFQEAFRVLRPGGRLMISDIVLRQELPKRIRDSIRAYVGCVAGALLKSDYIELIKKSGFKEVRVLKEFAFPIQVEIRNSMTSEIVKRTGITRETLGKIGESVLSISVFAEKPKEFRRKK